MAMGALVGWAILSVVTSIVAKKALGCWCGRRSEEYPGQGLHTGRDDSLALQGLLGVGTMKEGILLRESILWHEGVSRGCGSGGET